MVKLRYGWILLLAALLLSACGGDENKTPDEPDAPAVDATPTSMFPPTWTPVPTRTEPPRATIDYTYEAPETTPGVFPTRAPVTRVPTSVQQQGQPAPTEAAPAAVSVSSANQLVVTRDNLQATIDNQFNAIAGGFFEAAPGIRFEDEQVVAALIVYTTPAKKDTARLVMIECRPTIEDGRVVLTAEKIYFADDQSPYEDALAGYIVSALETAINDLFAEQYLTVRPAGGRYQIASITISDVEIVAPITPG